MYEYVFLVGEAGAAEIDDLECGSFRVLEDDVFRLQIAMDDGDIASRQESQRRQDLHREFTHKVQRDTGKVLVA